MNLTNSKNNDNNKKQQQPTANSDNNDYNTKKEIDYNNPSQRKFEKDITIFFHFFCCRWANDIFR